jgi:hypothetical protein
MKFRDDRPFGTPEAAERKLANAIEPDHAGRISVGVLNAQSGKLTAALRNTGRPTLDDERLGLAVERQEKGSQG